MAKQRKYNTAVIATDKNGNKFKYKSLEEASEKTGLSVRTIKSRAVNSGRLAKINLYLNGQIRLLKKHSKQNNLNKKEVIGNLIQ